MATDSYNLRGVLVRIQDNDTGSMHYHYLMFVDLPYTTQQQAILPVVWTYTNIQLNLNTGDYYIQGIVQNGNLPNAAGSGEFVRTFYIGMCTIPENYIVADMGTNLTAVLALQGATSALTSGDPCSRKPPIVRLSSSNPVSDGLNPSFAYGIQSKLGDFVFNGIETKHNKPDFFVIPILWCPTNSNQGTYYENVIKYINLTGTTIDCNPTLLMSSNGGDSAVMAVGCFDCTVNQFSIQNGVILGNGKNEFYGPDLPQTVTNLATNVTGIEIFWAEI